MSTAEIRQRPGWWSNLVEVVCDCGYRGPTHDLNARAVEHVLVKIERDQHNCAASED